MSMQRLAAMIAANTSVADQPIRIPYDGLDANVESPLLCKDPSLTRQSEAESTNINIIMKRYGWDEELVAQTFPASTGFYGDVTNIPDYQAAQERIAKTTQYFATLPLNIRQRFNENPAALLDFLADPANIEEAADLGLITMIAPPAPPPAATPPAPPAPPTGSGTPPEVAK